MPSWYISGFERPRGPILAGGGAAAFQGAGDIVTGAIYYAGLRAYNAAYATGSNAALVAKNSGTDAPTTVNILSTGYLDFATLNTLIGGDANQYLGSLTDQTGGAAGTVTFNIVTSSPQFKQNALGTYTSIYWQDGSARVGSSANNLAQSQPFTWVAVAYTEAGGTDTIAQMAGGGGPTMSTGGMSANGGATTLAASPGPGTDTWYVIIGAFNGASSVINLSGTETSGDANSGAMGAAKLEIGHGFGSIKTSKLRLMEFGIWPALFNGTQRTNMVTNCKNAWGIS